MLLALLQNFSQDPIPLLLPKNSFELGRNENQKLKNFNRVLSDVQVVNLNQVHNYLETVQF